MLLESMPYLMKQQHQRPMGPGGHPGGPRGYQGNPKGPGGMRPNNRGQYMNQQNRGPMHGQMGGPQQQMMG